MEACLLLWTQDVQPLPDLPLSQRGWRVDALLPRSLGTPACAAAPASAQQPMAPHNITCLFSDG